MRSTGRQLVRKTARACWFIWLVLLAPLFLAACASGFRSQEGLGESANEPIDMARSTVERSAADLAQQADKLRQGVERSGDAVSAPPAVVDLFETEALKKTISVDVRGTPIGPLLSLLARELGVSMSVEPRVLALPQKANLYLHSVTGVQALRRILALFDVDAVMGPDGVMAVSLLCERTFEIDMLQGRTHLTAGSGGDLMGSGGSKDGNSGLKDIAALGGEFGDKSDNYENLTKSLEGVLGKVNANADHDGPRYVLDKANGLLVVSARPSKMRLVESWIQKAKGYRDRLIQIDAQVVDVQLSDGTSIGIDWSVLSRNLVGRLGVNPATISGLTNLSSIHLPPGLGNRTITLPAQTAGGDGAGGLVVGNDSFSLALNALRSFGTVRVLSNPTVRLRNGVPALLSVGTNIRYVRKVTSQTAVGGGGTSTAADIETDSIFSGIVFGVVAAARNDGTIELFVKPSQNEVNADSLALRDVGAGLKVTLPVVNTKSVSTTLNLRSGETVLIGGLIDQQLIGTNNGVPGLGDVPAAGALFNSTTKKHATRELVVVLRARVAH